MLRFFLYVFLIAVVVLLIVGAQQLLTSFGVSGLSVICTAACLIL